MNHIEDAVGQAGFFQQFGQQQRGGRVAFARLENEAVSGRNRQRQHPQRNHGGKVERSDAGHDTERLAHREQIDAWTRAIAVLPFYQVGDATRKLHDLEAALDIAFGIGKGLAVLG